MFTGKRIPAFVRLTRGMKFRLVLLTALLFLDFFMLPLLLQLPWYVKEQGFQAGLAGWKQFVAPKPFAGPVVLFREEKTRTVWYYFQPMAMAAVIGIFTQYGLMRRKKGGKDIGGPDAVGQGQFGTARWQTEKEVNSNFHLWNAGRELPGGGVVLGAKRQGKNFYAWLDTDDTHTLLIGATRSGKSRRQIMPSIWTIARSGESMIMPDPKKELYNTTAGYLREQGYNVILLDFQDPGSGNRWNLLYPVIMRLQSGDAAGASKAAKQLAHMLTYQFQRPEDYKGDKIWPQSQKSLTAALALAVSMEAPAPGRHMGSVYRTLTTLGKNGGEDLDVYFNSLDDDHPAKIAYGVAAMAWGKLRNGIFTGTAAQLEMWSDPGVCWLTAEQDHDLAAPGREKTAVFIVVPDEDSSLHILAALYIAQVYQALTELARANCGRLDKRVHFLLEEFGNLPPIPDFAEKITLAGGRGMKFLLAIQGLDQVKKRYQDDATTITGNCNTWVYLSTADYETARLLSEKTGKYTQQTESLSAQVRKIDHTRGVSYGLAGRALLLPDEVLRWPVGRSLIFRGRTNPARLPLPDLSEWPAAADFGKSSITSGKGAIVLPEIWVPKPGPVEDTDDFIVEKAEPVDILSEL
ncbi:VirD4-like conjugal transfer protein, CD1115 family [Desulfotruncus alcoholivorax]|uniref:VirD4-like conjugal transfer protein, CD1115 family n=1 Tax=Desulfotruncus alcoholivorax TaxID=265477 RepID=UPI000411A08D|nr:type IV secretory system conjugative DNA transfer family protein [Desulfotruncus alcoholivorax]